VSIIHASCFLAIAMVTFRFLLPLLFICKTVLGLGQDSTITFQPTNDTLALAYQGSAVQVLVDKTDWPAVLRAANDLASDFGRVSGVNGSLTLVDNVDNYNISANTAGVRFSENPRDASMIFNVSGLTSFEMVSSGPKRGFIIAGTIGNSSLIDRLIAMGKIDISAVEGTWEAFTSTVVADPMPGVASALVIAGMYDRSVDVVPSDPIQAVTDGVPSMVSTTSPSR